MGLIFSNLLYKRLASCLLCFPVRAEHVFCSIRKIEDLRFVNGSSMGSAPIVSSCRNRIIVKNYLFHFPSVIFFR